MLCKILTLPLVVGIGYEFLMFSAKHDNIVTKVLTAPGLWIQRITTREPDASQIEVAIRSLKCALPDEFPEETAIVEAENAAEKADVSEKSFSASGTSGCFHFRHNPYPVWRYSIHNPADLHEPSCTYPSRHPPA